MDEAVARRTIDQVRRLGRDIERFRSRMPENTSPGTPAPPFTWEQLERQLADLSGPSAQRSLAAALVSATRKQASCKPPEMVLREILVLAATLLDESFAEGSGEGTDLTI